MSDETKITTADVEIFLKRMGDQGGRYLFFGKIEEGRSIVAMRDSTADIKTIMTLAAAEEEAIEDVVISVGKFLSTGAHKNPELLKKMVTDRLDDLIEELERMRAKGKTNDKSN